MCSALASRTPFPVQAAAPGRQEPGLEILPSAAAAEAVWRALEREGTASPYQRFDWVEAQAAAGQDVRVLLLRGEDGRALMLLPLALERRAGLRVATLPGAKHANFQLPVLAVGAALDPALVARSLEQAGRRLGIDAYAVGNVPAEWGGVANPLVGLGHARPNPSDAYLRTLGPDAEAVLAEAFGRETRKKLRKKERMLAERGTLSFGQALTPEAVDETLDVFLTQKGERMRALGIDDPFAEAGTRAFLRRACHAGLARGEPAIELYALRLDERIIATFGGTGDRERLCGMFNSFDLAPDLERCSPGEVLLSRLVRLQCERGRVLFDLGVGEARYKEALCDRVVPLRDVIVPVTVRGRAYAAGSGLVITAKRAIKRHPVAWRLATALRAALRRGR